MAKDLNRQLTKDPQMENKHIKDALSFICDQRSTNWNKIGYCYTPVKMAKIQNTDTKCWERSETTTLIHWCLEGKLVQPLWKRVCSFTNLSKLLLYNPAVVLLSIYSNELKFTPTPEPRSFTVALPIIAKTRKAKQHIFQLCCA